MDFIFRSGDIAALFLSDNRGRLILTENTPVVLDTARSAFVDEVLAIQLTIYVNPLIVLASRLASCSRSQQVVDS